MIMNIEEEEDQGGVKIRRDRITNNRHPMSPMRTRTTKGLAREEGGDPRAPKTRKKFFMTIFKTSPICIHYLRISSITNLLKS